MDELNYGVYDNSDIFSGLFSGFLGVGIIFFYFFIAVLMLVCMWKIFEKAGKPGWAAIVPLYNVIVLLEIANKPVWWIILFIIPLVNIIIIILIYIAIAKAFGKGTGFALGLLFLGFIFYPILAFGNAKYIGTEATE